MSSRKSSFTGRGTIAHMVNRMKRKVRSRRKRGLPTSGAGTSKYLRF